jgi:hypothetical protein
MRDHSYVSNFAQSSMQNRLNLRYPNWTMQPNPDRPMKVPLATAQWPSNALNIDRRSDDHGHADLASLAVPGRDPLRC